MYEIDNGNLWKKAYGIKISTVFIHACLPKLESLAYSGLLQCGWVDPTSPPQPPAGPPDQWCVNSGQRAMPGVSCIWQRANSLKDLLCHSLCAPERCIGSRGDYVGIIGVHQQAFDGNCCVPNIDFRQRTPQDICARAVSTLLCTVVNWYQSSYLWWLLHYYRGNHTRGSKAISYNMGK